MVKRSGSNRPQRRKNAGLPIDLVWLDVLAVLSWGGLLLKFWLTGKINILLHPDYLWLAAGAGIALVILGLIKGKQAWQTTRIRTDAPPTMQHMALFPPGWSSGLLLGVALLGLTFTPQPFSSQVALERGVTDTLTMTRAQPQSFRGGTKPEERSVIDWVRTLGVYPEPDAYKGQKANVEGFVIYPPDFPETHFLVSRFVITCCAADVYPVGLPVRVEGGRSTYPPDTWLRVEGQMATETLNNKRQLVIQAKTLTEIPAPKNPYDY